MPAKRRTRIKGQGKQKSSKSKESSSEDTDQCTAEDIVSRLARKYLLKSSTDTEHSDQKENERSVATVAVDPYDADLETSEVDTAASVDTASDMECLDTQPTPHILSPSRQANVGMARSTRSRGAFAAVGNSNKSMQRAKPTVHPPPASARETSAPTQPNRRHHTTRKSSVTPQRTPMESACTPKDDSLQQSDSGMFVSPLTGLPRRHLPKMNASDTSTPASAIGGIQSDLNDSCFGFDNITSPDPLGPISPVDPASPTDHPSLSRSSPGDASFTKRNRRISSYTAEPVKRKVSAALDMSSLVLDAQQPVKKPRKKPVKVDSEKMAKMQEWAAHMAEEFEDIEMNYDLTIEG